MPRLSAPAGILAVDTETTGLDLHHGAMPYIVTTCGPDQTLTTWEWDVDPLTRLPLIPAADIQAIKRFLAGRRTVLHNSKFDVPALGTVDAGLRDGWRWDLTEDSLMAGHLLASNHKHDLTSMVDEYLGLDIQPYEDRFQAAVLECRRIAAKHLPLWRIAHEALPEMPSYEGKGKWKADGWLPRALAKELGEPKDHPWWSVTREYADADSSATALLWPVLERLLKEGGWWAIYRSRMELPRIATIMERRAVTVNGAAVAAMKGQFAEDVALSSAVCLAIAANHDHELVLPKGGNNHSLQRFMFGFDRLACQRCGWAEEVERGTGPVHCPDCVGFRLTRRTTKNLGLPVHGRGEKSGEPSINKESMGHWMDTLPRGSEELAFVKALAERRKWSTGITYLEDYEHFWQPLEEVSYDQERISSQHLEGQKRLLGLDGKPIQERLRPVPLSGSIEGPSSKLVDTQGGYPEGGVRPPQMRQPALRQPAASVSGKPEGQHAGHDPQRKGRQGERGAAPTSQDDRQGHPANPKTPQGREDAKKPLSTVQYKSGAYARHNPQTLLETRRIVPDWYVLHPWLNPTGTVTLRWSSQRPNEQNISKQGEINLRRCFGPAPGREWWSADAQNIELRIPAYEAGEKLLIDVYEEPDKPPYYGSYHLVVFDTIRPEVFAKHGAEVKTLYEDTYYQWTKNGNFARQYGCQEAKGDATYRVPGAFRMLASRFPRIDALNRRYIAQANAQGFVETIPDREVDPKRGYPLLCERDNRGRILPTLPFCYHVSGTACQWMGKAMIRCQRMLDAWAKGGFDAWMPMQVHDELVFDLPKAADPRIDLKRSNWGRVRELKKEMEKGGGDIGIPTPCSVDYHPESWAVAVKIKA